MKPSAQRYTWALLRIGMGWIFLWPFFDKLFGLGFSTAPDKSWLAGSSPTTGFLSHATQGPFAELYQSLAGNAFVDWLFMLGLLGIGVALILGIAMRLAVISGSLMLLMMFTAVLPPEHNPLIDDHIIYTLALWGLLAARSGEHFGWGKAWKSTEIAKNIPLLR